MKLTKKLEAEVLKAYNGYWDNYLNGNVEAMHPLLADEYTQVGSAESEMFSNKKDAVQFLYNTIEQVAGKLEMRNRKTTLEQQEHAILIHEFCDLYALAEGSWIFYSKFRASTFMQQKKDGWKIIHQHSSFPDAKAADGENIAIDKIAAENQQLREAIKRRTIELEQKNKELEIETALEKVRAEAMGMKKPDDILAICKVMFTELQSLGFSEIRNTLINFWDDDNSLLIDYDYSTDTGGNKARLTYSSHPVFEQFQKIIKNSQDAFAELVVTKDELESWKQRRRESGEYEDARLNNLDALYYYFYSIGVGAIGISTFGSITEEKLNVLKRFRNVFDFAYRRYADVAQAEAQAREAQIEVSLERVRSASMAMHSSDELQKVIRILTDQLTVLGFEFHSANFITNASMPDWEIWISSPGSNMPPKLFVPYFNHRLFNERNDAVTSGKDMLTAVLSAEEKNSFLNYFFEHSISKNTDEDRMKWVLNQPGMALTTVVTKSFSLSVINYYGKLYTESENEVIKRLAQVFEQSYTRFLDLQKAEAQARAAQIQLALERVRAKTMAMQNSDELGEVVAILFEELVKLDLILARCIIWIFEHDSLAARMWMANSEDKKIAKSYFVKYLDHPYYNSILSGWKEKNQKWIYFLKGDDKKTIDRLLLNETELSQLPETVKQGILSSEETFVAGSFNNFGLIEASGPSKPTDEQLDILNRFGKIFDLSYTRFNDLKQTEAQAKDAQIELGLERVRARAMAMQQSDELKEVILTLTNQLHLLNFDFDSANLATEFDDKGFYAWNAVAGNDVISEVYVPYSNHTFSIWLVKNWQQQTLFTSFLFSKREKNDFFNYYFTETDGRYIPDDVKKFMLQGEAMAVSSSFRKNFVLSIFTYRTKVFLKEEEDIINRFASVFDQSYTRFLDLQKAEAQTEIARLNLIQIQAEKQKAEEAFKELQATQKQLIQSEKMASLGELTAGIAHEIQNPLNFVNNFSEVNKELVDELKLELATGNMQTANEIADDIKENSEKINHHGKRADAIVKGMLQHSSSGSGKKEPTDINKLADEYLRLAYHGLRAKDKSFNATMKTDFDKTIGNINIIPQDIGRVILNLITNAFYVVDEKKKAFAEKSSFENLTSLYEPTVSVGTKKDGNKVLISVKDNGNGIPQKILDKIFQPFFTTKPTGQGTGLGLSLSYDIVKAHGGELKVETKEGEGSEFIIQLSG